MNTAASFIALNIVFLITCIPIITIGSALSALYEVSMKEARGEYGYLIKPYFKCLKENLLSGSLAFCFYAILLLFLGFGIVFWQNLDTSFSYAAVAISCVLALVVLIAAIYTFPLIARFENPILRTIKNAFCITLGSLKYSFLFLLLHLFEFSLVYLFSGVRIFMLLIGFSFFAYCNAFLFNHFFKRFYAC